MKLIGKTFLKQILSRERAENLINSIASKYELDLLDMAHRNMGIMKYQTSKVSGEEFFLNKMLPAIISNNNSEELILFDVGANKGDYSAELEIKFKVAKIHSFEPNPATFKFFTERFKTSSNIKANCLGLGSRKETNNIYTYGNEASSEHASIFKNVLIDLHKSQDIQHFVIEIDTIDEYCSDNNVKRINFLKIDTEGFELEVLKGANTMISTGMIDVIQFEFNEMNIISRVFLKDFYEILNNYKFYRMDSNRIIPLDIYCTINEIFRFQNIVAIRDGLIIE